MDEGSSRNEALYARIQQLEQERDELRKEIEQLCMQKAGPSYIAVATRMHFRRTAGLEQEIENLKNNLESCAKENSDLKKELSEAKRINRHLGQLHKQEATKNAKLVKQLELLDAVVATASGERDHAMMEAVQSKENEDMMSQKLNDAEKRAARLEQEVENLKKKFECCTQENSDIKKDLSEATAVTKHLDQLRKLEVTKNTELVRQLELCNGVVATTSAERDHAMMENTELVKQLELSQGIAATASAERDHAMMEAVKANENEDLISQKLNNAEKRQAALLEQLETLRCSVDDHRDKLRMILSNKLITEGVSSLREYHAQQRIQIMDPLDDGKSYLQAVVVSIEEKLGDLSAGSGSAVVTEVTNSAPNVVQSDDSSKTVGQALQEKQQERHLLEVRTALRGTLDELQRNLKQATEEKVDALMELADVKQEYQLLLERTIQERQDSLTGSSERIKLAAGRDGKLKYLLKRKTSLKRWFSAKENLPPLVDPQAGQEGPSTSDGSNLSMDDARLQIENATLKDNIQGLKCLTSNVRKLRHSLMQAKETPVSEGTKDVTLRLLDGIFWEAELIKNALGSPFWPGEGNTASSGDVIVEKDHEDSKFDLAFAAGLEMVELLLLATQIIKEKMGR